ncbi:hypothetical protein ABK040_012086 [Willaertia magna]
MNKSITKSLTTNNGTERKRSYSTNSSNNNNLATVNLKKSNIPPSFNHSSFSSSSSFHHLQQQPSNSFNNNNDNNNNINNNNNKTTTIIKEQRTRSNSNNTESNSITTTIINTPRKKWNKEEYQCQMNNSLKKTIPSITNTSYSNLNATFYSLPSSPRGALLEINNNNTLQHYTLKSFTNNKGINNVSKNGNKLNKTMSIIGSDNNNNDSGIKTIMKDGLTDKEMEMNNEIIENIERQKKRNLKLIEELYNCNEHYSYLQNILNNLNKNSNINNIHYIIENLVDIITYFNIYKNSSVLTTSDIVTTKKKNSTLNGNNLIENNKLLSTFVQIVQLFLKKLTKRINNEELKKFVFIYQPILISSFQQVQNYNNDLLNLLQIIVNEC